ACGLWERAAARRRAGAAPPRPPRLSELTQDAILDPLRAPPIERRHRTAAEQHREVQVIASGETGRAGAADSLLHLDHIADRDVDRRKVRIERYQPPAVVYDDAVVVASHYFHDF